MFEGQNYLIINKKIPAEGRKVTQMEKFS